MTDRDLAARRLLAVTEEELRRVVLDIHDGPVQHLFAARGQLSLLAERLAGLPDATDCAAPLARAEALLESSLQDIRQIVAALHAPEFTAQSIATFVEELAVQHETLTSRVVTLDIVSPLLNATPLVKIALYRVLQEALSNIRRHACSQTTCVRVREDRGYIDLEIEDDGRGFEPPPLVGPDATERNQHIGLRGMRERAAMVGGTLTVESRPGSGTRVHVRIACDGSASSATRARA